MKTKLLTICLLLFSSQVFAEDIIIKCQQTDKKNNIHVYKYSENLFGLFKKIELRKEIKWVDWCTSNDENIREIETSKLGGTCVSLPKVAKSSSSAVIKSRSFVDFVQPARKMVFNHQSGQTTTHDFKCSFIEKNE